MSRSNLGDEEFAALERELAYVRESQDVDAGLAIYDGRKDWTSADWEAYAVWSGRRRAAAGSEALQREAQADADIAAWRDGRRSRSVARRIWESYPNKDGVCFGGVGELGSLASRRTPEQEGEREAQLLAIAELFCEWYSQVGCVAGEAPRSSFAVEPSPAFLRAFRQRFMRPDLWQEYLSQVIWLVASKREGFASCEESRRPVGATDLSSDPEQVARREELVKRWMASDDLPTARGPTAASWREHWRNRREALLCLVEDARLFELENPGMRVSLRDGWIWDSVRGEFFAVLEHAGDVDG